MNFAYNLWFLVLVAAFVACACATRRQALRHQYLMSFMLVWFVGGFLVAMGFSSAGPCYYARIGLGDLYAAADVGAASGRRRSIRSGRSRAQDMLWQGFTGGRPGSAGISAFPSMHVATATLFALAARRLHPWLFAAGLAYWAVIMLGSVLLGWHYAVDGYAGTLIALLAWRLCRALRTACRGSGARGRRPDQRPLRHRRQRHQHRLRVVAGLQPEAGAAVVEQVELGVAAALHQLRLALCLGPGLAPCAAR